MTGETERRAKAIVDDLLGWAQEASSDEERKRRVTHWARSCGAGRIHAMVDLARTESGIPVLVDELDPDPHLLAVQNGLVDLRTGELAAPDPARMVTRLVGLDYDPGSGPGSGRSSCGGLRRGRGTDRLRPAGRRLLGHRLNRRAQAADPPRHGPQRQVDLSGVTQMVLGPWASTAVEGLLVTHHHDQHPERLAQLHRRRMVASFELEQRRTLAESLVKYLTGGDTVTARFLHQNSFTFVATHTLWLVTNHRPRIKGTDPAIKSRVKLIPFTVTIPEDQRIQDYTRSCTPSAGRPSWPGSWRVPSPGRGRSGTCGAVDQATSEYLAAEDLFARWLSEPASRLGTRR